MKLCDYFMKAFYLHFKIIRPSSKEFPCKATLVFDVNGLLESGLTTADSQSSINYNFDRISSSSASHLHYDSAQHQTWEHNTVLI